MSRALVDGYDDPERVIAELNRRLRLKVYGVVGALIVILGVMFAAAAAMYSDEPEAAKSARVAH